MIDVEKCDLALVLLQYHDERVCKLVSLHMPGGSKVVCSAGHDPKLALSSATLHLAERHCICCLHLLHIAAVLKKCLSSTRYGRC